MRLNNCCIRFADDQAMIANTKARLGREMDNLNAVAEDHRMKLRIKKTKVMKIGRHESGRIKKNIDGKELEEVKKMKYLGSTINGNGYCETNTKNLVG